MTSRSSPRLMKSSDIGWTVMKAVSWSSTMHSVADPWNPLVFSRITPWRSSMASMQLAFISASTVGLTGSFSRVWSSIMRPRTPPHCSLTTAANVSNISLGSPTSVAKPNSARFSSWARM